jgi:hypothetical protein
MPDCGASIFASLGAALGGATGSGIATGIGAAASLAGAGASIAQATRKEPGQKIVAPPTVTEAADAAVKQKARVRRGLGYRDTILSQAIQGGPGGKSLLGQ